MRTRQDAHGNVTARPRWAKTVAVAAALVLLVVLVAVVPSVADAQEGDDGAPDPVVFVVAEDGDGLGGSGISLADAVQFAAGDATARHFAVVGADTDREVRLDVDADGPLVDDDRGVGVVVSGCTPPRGADPTSLPCSSWTEHYDGRLADMGEIGVGAAPASQARLVRVVLSLPADAPNTLQGTATTAVYTLTAVDATWSSPPEDGEEPEEVGRLPRTGTSIVAILLAAAVLIAGGTVVVTSGRGAGRAPPPRRLSRVGQFTAPTSSGRSSSSR